MSTRSTALITGASSGIGRAFALHYASRGSHIVAVGRDGQALEQLCAEVIAQGGSAELCMADLSNADGVALVVDHCPDPEVLVANAGVTIAGRVGTVDWNDLDRMAFLLGTGVAQLVEGVAPAMMKKGSGDIILVSSIASLIQMPGSAMYAASKTFVTAYGRSVAPEVGKRGVRLCVVCPGYVHTNLHERAGLGHLSTQVPNWMWIRSETVVRAAEKGLQRGKTVVVPGRVYRYARPFLNSSVAQWTWSRITRKSRASR